MAAQKNPSIFTRRLENPSALQNVQVKLTQQGFVGDLDSGLFMFLKLETATYYTLTSNFNSCQRENKQIHLNCGLL